MIHATRSEQCIQQHNS